MANWLSMGPTVGGTAMVAAQKELYWEHAHLLSVGGMLYMVFTSCVRFKRVAFAFLRKIGAMCGGIGMILAMLVWCWLSA